MDSKLILPISLFIAFISSAMVAHAQAPSFNPNDLNLEQRVNQGYEQSRACRAGACDSSCAPEVKNSNIDILDATLIKLANSPEFSNEAAFRNFVTQTTEIPNVDRQLSNYGAVIGLNQPGKPVVNKVLLDFLGSRDFSKYAQAAQKNLRLQPAHAKILVESIAKDLLSGSN